MAQKYTYMELIGRFYPEVGCHSEGDGTVYEDIIYDYGDSIPEKSVLDAKMTDAIKVDMWENIKTERDRRKDTGGYKVGNYWFHSDTTSRIQQVALAMLGANLPANILWKTMSGAFVPMTPTLAAQIFQAAMVSDTIIFATAEQKKTAMMASSDPENFDYLSGWPKIYGEE